MPVTLRFTAAHGHILRGVLYSLGALSIWTFTVSLARDLPSFLTWQKLPGFRRVQLITMRHEECRAQGTTHVYSGIAHCRDFIPLLNTLASTDLPRPLCPCAWRSVTLGPEAWWKPNNLANKKTPNDRNDKYLEEKKKKKRINPSPAAFSLLQYWTDSTKRSACQSARRLEQPPPPRSCSRDCL